MLKTPLKPWKTPRSFPVKKRKTGKFHGAQGIIFNIFHRLPVESCGNL